MPDKIHSDVLTVPLAFSPDVLSILAIEADGLNIVLTIKQSFAIPLPEHVVSIESPYIENGILSVRYTQVIPLTEADVWREKLGLSGDVSDEDTFKAKDEFIAESERREKEELAAQEKQKSDAESLQIILSAIGGLTVDEIKERLGVK